MPKTFFKTEQMTALKDIPRGGQIHLIGVCGVAMGQLAVELASMGYKVSGSDKEFYEPMGSFLKGSNIEIKKGYAAANVPPNVDLVVIGNTVSYGHPEVAVIEERSLPYTCFPRLLCESIIAGKLSIVIAGTHGKSTTTAMTTTILRAAGSDPSYFVGGVIAGFDTSLHRGEGNISVVEGDEYDDVFFSKKAKFTHYSPDTFVINAIEYDHADLYPNIESIKDAFRSGVSLIPQDGKLVACIDFPIVKEMLAEWRKSLKCNIITFGVDAAADYRIASRQTHGFAQNVQVKVSAGTVFSFSLPAIGEYNARNALAAIIVTSLNGLSLEQATEALKNFQTVKRRQEVRFDRAGIVLIEDFAHHPTAVYAILSGVRDAYPDKKIWAVFEARSNTSRRKVFERNYLQSFSAADQAIIAEVVARELDTGQELIDVHELAESVSKSGVPCQVLPDAQTIATNLMENVSSNDVIVVMSNGSFGGLPALLEAALEEAYP